MHTAGVLQLILTLTWITILHYVIVTSLSGKCTACAHHVIRLAWLHNIIITYFEFSVLKFEQVKPYYYKHFSRLLDGFSHQASQTLAARKTWTASQVNKRTTSCVRHASNLQLTLLTITTLLGINLTIRRVLPACTVCKLCCLSWLLLLT